MRVLSRGSKPTVTRVGEAAQPLQGWHHYARRDALNLDNFARRCNSPAPSGRQRERWACGAIHAVKAVSKEKLLASGGRARSVRLDENSILRVVEASSRSTMHFAFPDIDAQTLIRSIVWRDSIPAHNARWARSSRTLVRLLRGAARRGFAYLHLKTWLQGIHAGSSKHCS